MTRCTQCGAGIPDGYALCSACSARQANAQTQRPSYPQDSYYAQPQQGYQAPGYQPSPYQQSPYQQAQPVYPQQGYPARQNYPAQQGYSAYPQQSYPAQPQVNPAYPQQSYPAQQGYPSQQNYPSQQQGYSDYSRQNAPYQQPRQSAPAPRRAAPSAQAVAQGMKAAKSGASFLKWLVPLLLVASLAIAAYILLAPPKSDEQLIRERIAAFEKAYTSGDYDGMMDCLDSTMQAATDISMGFMDGLMGEMTGFGGSMKDMFGLVGLMGDFCDFNIHTINIDGDTATVDLTMVMKMYGTSSQSERMTLPMVKDGRNWYIGIEGMNGLF